MWSDQEQRSRAERIQPEIEKLLQQLDYLETNPQALVLFREIQPILDGLTPLSKRHNWLETYLEQVETFLEPYRQSLDGFKRQLLIHLLVFGVLLMAPIMALLLGADMSLSSLLFLPVIGWGYLGIWQYSKPLREKILLPKVSTEENVG